MRSRQVNMHSFRVPGRHHQRALRVIGLVYALCMAFALLSCMTPAQAQVPQTAQQHKRALVRAAHAQWGLDAPIAVFAAQIHQESAWNPNAISRVGAQGLAQFMPATATWWCDITGIAKSDCMPTNPTWALRSMVGYNKWLYDRTPSRYGEFDRLWVMLRAYNGGLGHWQNESRATGLTAPSRPQVDGACGKARRSVTHCRENLGYPDRILNTLQPRYELWGGTVRMD